MSSNWKNKLELAKEYEDPDFREKFVDLFTLRNFVSRSVIKQNYVPPAKLCDSLSFTDIGKITLESLSDLFSDQTEEQLKFLLFLFFYHKDLYIDTNNTNIENLSEQINSEILTQNFRIPYIYGRELYNRFFEFFSSETNRLEYTNTQKLLEGTPIGIFSAYKYISGPFGLIKGIQSRSIFPVNKIHLWHCSDPSCFAPHYVNLSSGKSIERCINSGTNFLTQELGPPSEWWGFYHDILYPSSQFYDDMNTRQLPILLGEIFNEEEMKLILEYLFTNYSKELRSYLPTNRSSKLLVSSPFDISSRLNQYQCFQLILIAKDHQIINAIDRLIEDEQLKVPTTEIRTIKRSMPYSSGGLRPKMECGRLGYRTYVKKPNARLRRLLLTLDANDNTSEPRLNWVLRDIEGNSLGEKIEQYASKENPKKIVKSYCFKSQPSVFKTLEHLNIIRKSLPTTQEKEDLLIEQILWKLGFDVKTYPPSFDKYQRLKSLFQTALGLETSLNFQEDIRKAAINYFVYFEELLNQTLSFLTWLLFENHWIKTKFRFSLSRAQEFMGKKLMEFQKEEGASTENFVEFNLKGRNTLYPLINGQLLLAKKCERYQNNKEKSLRPKNELPNFVGHSSLRKFHFFHTELIGDLQSNDVTKLIKNLRKVHSLLEKAKIANIRNRIQHPGENFPTIEEIRDMIEISNIAMKILEEEDLFPTYYILNKISQDQFEREEYLFSNYKGKEVIYRPTSIRMFQNEISPQILVPSLKFKDTTDFVRCVILEESNFTKYWLNYPLRKTRINSSQNKKHVKKE